MKRFLKELMTIVVVGFFSIAQSFAFTDLLPVGAASDTIPVSNGTGWTLQQMPTNWTLFRGSLAGADGAGYTTVGATAYSNGLAYTIYSSSSVQVIGSGTALSTWSACGYGGLGTNSIPAAWFLTPGKTIRVKGSGMYTSSAGPGSWKWGVSLATGTLCVASSTIPVSGTNIPWNEEINVTMTSTGTGGIGTAVANVLLQYSTGTVSIGYMTSSATVSGIATINFNSAVKINPTFQWDTTGNSITANSYTIELLN
jgi:hypothetical protein